MADIGILFHDGPRHGATTRLAVSPNHTFVLVPTDPASGITLHCESERYDPTGRTEQRDGMALYVFAYKDPEAA